MDRTIPNAKQKLKNVEAFLNHRVGHPNCWDVSSAKRDGTVFIRFFSTTAIAATEYANAFADAMEADGLGYVRADDTKFRVELDQFGVG